MFVIYKTNLAIWLRLSKATTVREIADRGASAQERTWEGTGGLHVLSQLEEVKGQKENLELIRSNTLCLAVKGTEKE